LVLDKGVRISYRKHALWGELVTSAEGATAPVNSQANGPQRAETLERGVMTPAEGITISGARTEGASLTGKHAQMPEAK